MSISLGKDYMELAKTMTDKQIINGLKYEKLSEDQLYDLSSWELVDIILAYRKDCKAKEQECEELKKINKANAKSYEKHWYKLEKYKQTLTEIKEIAQFACEKSVCDRNHCDYCSDGQILQKISECEVK